MNIKVMLIDGKEKFVSKDELQNLLLTNQVICFERSAGCVFVGYDQMRELSSPYLGKDRRKYGAQAC